MVTSIGCMNTENDNYYIASLSNGVVKIFNCKTGAHLVDIQAHSRQINALACHPSKPIFVTVSDDTIVNLWKCKATDKEVISEVNLIMS